MNHNQATAIILAATNDPCHNLVTEWSTTPEYVEACETLKHFQLRATMTFAIVLAPEWIGARPPSPVMEGVC